MSRSRFEGRGIEASADWRNLRSPETYVGYDRTQNFRSPGGVVRNQPRNYELPARLRVNDWGLSGDWTVKNEAVAAEQAQRAHRLPLSCARSSSRDGPRRPGNVRAISRADRRTSHQAPPTALDVDEQGYGTVTGQRLYQLIRQPGPSPSDSSKSSSSDQASRHSPSHSADPPHHRTHQPPPTQGDTPIERYHQYPSSRQEYPSVPEWQKIPFKLEAVVIPVSDVDRAKRSTADWAGGSTPISPSATRSGWCSPRLRARRLRSTSARESLGRARLGQRLYLVVSDIEAARADLISRGVEVSEVFHVPVRDSPCSWTPGSGGPQLLLLRHVQRSGWQQLAVAGGHRTIPRTRGLGRNDVRFGG